MLFRRGFQIEMKFKMIFVISNLQLKRLNIFLNALFCSKLYLLCENRL